MYKQIGNAVPVLLAKKIAKPIKKHLDKYGEKEHDVTRNRVA
jgi:site-specific DNA-cytosine methylase